MANTLPGTPYVESSDLVANYPAVSEDLAERVDLVGVLPFADSTARGTALPTPTDGQYSYLQDTNSTEYWNGSAWVAAGVAPGLVHLNTTSFTSVSSVSVDSVFTSTYENYKIIAQATGSASTSLRYRLRVSSSDDTANSYNTQRLTADNTSLSGARATATSAEIGQIRTSESSYIIEVQQPQLAERTLFHQMGTDANTQISWFAGFFNASTVFDGFTLFPFTGTFSGTLRVYGYKNS